MNFARDVVAAAPPSARALIEITRDGTRREWTFAEVDDASARLAGYLHGQGARRGDIVLVWLGNRAEWVLSMLACFRAGLVAAACPEQLRAKDLAVRVEAVSPALIVADERNRDELARTRMRPGLDGTPAAGHSHVDRRRRAGRRPAHGSETAPYKYPRQIEFVRELPKTASGKMKRAELRHGPA